MLGEIPVVLHKQPLLHSSRRCKVPVVFQKAYDCFGHTPHEQVLPQKPAQPVLEWRDLLEIQGAHHTLQPFLTRSTKILQEAGRVHIDHLHLSHRKRCPRMVRNAQIGSGGRNVVGRRILCKRLHEGQRVLSLLNLVKYDERFPRDDLCASVNRYVLEGALCVVASF